ncbi:MAG: [NiFe]-hydrogenase assembly chaperone HybE [Methylocystis sp.]
MSAQAIGDALAARYREIESKAMRNAPICNAALQVEAIGFREYDGYAVGIILTPWFINLVAAETQPSGKASGLPLGPLPISLPAGSIEFTVVELEGFGRLASCSLFSPLFEFPDQETACAVAQEALDAAFDPGLHAAKPEPRPPLDRRAFLRGARSPQGAAS